MHTEYAKHTRTSGRRLTYDIEATNTRFIISLDGKVLCDSGPMQSVGGVTGAKAMVIHAKSAIEHLTHDMTEE